MPLTSRFVTLIFGFALCALLANHAALAVDAGERATLRQLYTSASGNKWNDHEGWNAPPSSECDWPGVCCDVDRTHGLLVRLNHTGFEGTLPALDGLQHLQTFEVAENPGLQRPIPRVLGLHELQVFDVTDNALAGGIPELDGLLHLERISLSQNHLNGGVPTLRNLPALTEFAASENALTGTIPSFAQLPRLRPRSVDGNAMSGTLQEWHDLPELPLLSLAFNQLDGDLGLVRELPGLEYVRLFNNQFSGDLGALRDLPTLHTAELDNHMPERVQQAQLQTRRRLGRRDKRPAMVSPLRAFDRRSGGVVSVGRRAIDARHLCRENRA
ncbi:MAG: hypothetical protein ABI411_20155 [Tahibacter sp.]